MRKGGGGSSYARGARGRREVGVRGRRSKVPCVDATRRRRRVCHTRRAFATQLIRASMPFVTATQHNVTIRRRSADSAAGSVIKTRH